MNNDFMIIGITSPIFFDGEAERINKLLSNNEVDYIHIRKPESTILELKKLIEKINPEFFRRLKLHDHFELLDVYPLGGIHLNKRNNTIHPKATSISYSVHSINEIEEINEHEYFFISPVFDSISKKGYKSGFNLNELSLKIKGKKAIALGGITPQKIPLLKKMGFYGAAMLGYFFPD